MTEKQEIIIEDGHSADERINKLEDKEDLPVLFNYFRYGIIAEYFLRTAVQYRTRIVEYDIKWNFKRLFKKI